MEGIMLEKVTDHIYYMMNDDEKDRRALGLVIGKNGCLVVDAGNSPKHAKLMQEEIKNMNLPPVKYVVLTHHHKDHIGGLSSWDAISIASKETANMILSEFGEKEWNNTRITLLYDGELLIDLGECLCSIREIVNPHRKDGTIVYVESEKTLFVGDAAYGRNINDHNYLDRNDVKTMMKEINEYDWNYVLCAHESICNKEEMISYWNNINLAAEITMDCNLKEEAIYKFEIKYGCRPSTEELFFIESFFK